MKPDHKHNKKQPPPPEPVDMRDGIPDAAQRRPAWKYVLIGVVFAAWIAFLVYVYLAARV
jgi:hypothetical protein